MTEHHVIDLSRLASSRDGSGHSIFSPSSSWMWLWCLGSLIANIMAPDDAGIDAAWGTVAHDLTEQGLKTGRLPRERLGEKVWIESGDWGFLIDIDEEMLHFVQIAIDYCEWLVGDHFVEERVFFSEYTPLKNQSGTADHTACAPGIMTVTDHKFGKGVRVFAAMDHKDKRTIIFNDDGSFKINGNPQALLYALGFFLKWDHKYHFQRIVVRISQPRLDHFDEWETTREELLKFAEFVKVRSHLAWRLDAPRRPHPKACQWCKVSATCAANASLQESLVAAAFDHIRKDVSVETMEDLKERLDDPLGGYELKLANINTLSIEQLATLYSFRASAERWWKSLHETMVRRAAAGDEVPGYKMVESRSHRVFKNPKAAAKFLIAQGVPREQVIEENVVSPAEAEKLLQKRGNRMKDIPQMLSDLVRKPPGRPTLAPINDKRPALSNVSDAAFSLLSSNPETDDWE